MSDQHLRIFISSKMQELAAEREAIKAALDELHVGAWVFEKDAGARPQTIQATYLEEVEAADLYIGLFWKGYGPYTIEEYEHAEMLGMDCLIYEKRENIQGQRDPELQAFLDRINAVESGLTVRWFNTPDDLRKFVKEDVAAWQAKIIREGRKFSSPEVYVGVPPMPPHFVGRSDLVQKMVRQLRSGEDLSVEGLPGVGKTTLAVALARHLGVRRNFKDGILWASLGPHADLVSALTSWAEALKVDITRSISEPEQAQAIRDAIGQKRMLLMIDDVWDFNVAEALRCGGPNCCHLLTTRDKAIARKFVGAAQAKNLPTLDDNQAYQLLQALAPEACTADPDTVRNLVGVVGGLPLAIRLIGGYLAAPEHSMFPDLFPDLSDEALAELKNPQKRLQLAEQRLGVLNRKEITLQDTIALSLHGLPDSAKNAFYMLGAFAPKPARFNREAAEAVTQAGGSILALLAARNLLEIEAEEGQLAVHQIVADVARTNLDEAAVARHSNHFLTLVKQNQYDWWLIFDVYGQIRQAWQNTPEDASMLEWIFALRPYFSGRSLWREYLEWANRALVVVARLCMRKEEGQLSANIGLAHYYLGEWDNAIDHFQQARSILKVVGDRIGFTRILHNIGMTYYAKDDKEGALDHFQEALSIQEETGDRFALAETLYNMAEVHTELGDDIQATACYEQGRIIREEDKERARVSSQDEVHLAHSIRFEQEKRERPILLTVVHNFVIQDESDVDFEGHIALCVQREEDETRHYWHAVFANGKKVQAGYTDYIPRNADAMLLMGERESDAIISKGSLPENQRLLRVYGGRDLLKKFIDRYFKKPPEKEPDDPQKVAEKSHTLGLIFASKGQPLLAIQNYDTAIEIRTRLAEQVERIELANDLAESLNNRGRVLASLRRFPEATRDYDKAIEIRKRLVEENGKTEFAKDLSTTLGNRALLLTADSRFSEAIRDYDRTIEIQTRLLEKGQGEVAKELAANLSGRGLITNALGRGMEAARDYGKAIELHTRLVEEQGEHELAVELASNLSSRAAILNTLGQHKDAIRHYDKAIEIQRRLKEQEGQEELTHDLAADLNKRGRAFSALNQLQEAVQDFNEAIDLYTHLVDDQRQNEFAKDLAGILSICGLLYIGLNQLPDAEFLLDQAIKRYTRLVDEQGQEELAKDLARSLCNHALLMMNVSKLLKALEDYDRAIGIYTHLIEELSETEHVKDLANTLYNRGNVLADQGRFNEAVRDFERAINLYAPQVEAGDELAIDFAFCLNGLAWIQATCPEEAFRDGAKAVENATRACQLTDWDKYHLFDTLAAAYGEAGEFDTAVQWQMKALQSANDDEKVDFCSRLDLFRIKKAYRQTHREG